MKYLVSLLLVWMYLIIYTLVQHSTARVCIYTHTSTCTCTPQERDVSISAITPIPNPPNHIYHNVRYVHQGPHNCALRKMVETRFAIFKTLQSFSSSQLMVTWLAPPDTCEDHCCCGFVRKELKCFLVLNNQKENKKVNKNTERKERNRKKALRVSFLSGFVLHVKYCVIIDNCVLCACWKFRYRWCLYEQRKKKRKTDRTTKKKNEREKKRNEGWREDLSWTANSHVQGNRKGRNLLRVWQSEFHFLINGDLSRHFKQ